jgi:hypothetical protein
MTGVLFWLPTAAAVLLAAISLTWASIPPATEKSRRSRIASLLVFGSLSIAGSVWQGRQQVDDSGAVVGTTTSPQLASRDADGPTASDLRERVRTLEKQVRLLEATRQARTISQETAEQLAAYLKPFGSRRVVVSCAPDDPEAYRYANRLVNLLRTADWDAAGPEPTNIFGDVRAEGVNVYVNQNDNSDTGKVLLDAFAKFNIPYQGRVTPSQAIPDNTTVELYVGTAKSDRTTAAGGD